MLIARRRGAGRILRRVSVRWCSRTAAARRCGRRTRCWRSITGCRSARTGSSSTSTCRATASSSCITTPRWSGRRTGRGRWRRGRPTSSRGWTPGITSVRRRRQRLRPAPARQPALHPFRGLAGGVPRLDDVLRRYRRRALHHRAQSERSRAGASDHRRGARGRRGRSRRARIVRHAGAARGARLRAAHSRPALARGDAPRAVPIVGAMAGAPAGLPGIPGAGSLRLDARRVAALCAVRARGRASPSASGRWTTKPTCGGC